MYRCAQKYSEYWNTETYHKGSKCFSKITVTWIRLSYLNSVALLFNFISLDYESMVVVLHGSNFYHWLSQKKVFVERF